MTIRMRHDIAGNNMFHYFGDDTGQADGSVVCLCRLGLRVHFLYRLGFRVRIGVSSARFCIF